MWELRGLDGRGSKRNERGERDVRGGDKGKIHSAYDRDPLLYIKTAIYVHIYCTKYTVHSKHTIHAVRGRVYKAKRLQTDLTVS